MKFKHKPNIVEALQWFPGIVFIGLGVSKDKPNIYYVNTDQGKMALYPSNWVISYGKSIHVCDDETFKKLYDPDRGKIGIVQMSVKIVNFINPI